MNYQSSTLRLGTQFDPEIVPLSVPGVAHKGNDSALCILDGANRAPRRLSRLVRRVGLLGLKVANPGEGVRVTMTLVVDHFSTEMWNKMHRSGDDVDMPDEFAYHRMVEISAQGRPRGIVMLAHRRGDKNGVRQQIQFDVMASDIGESGLLMFGLEEPVDVPAWAGAGLLESSLVGACVAGVRLDHLETHGIEPSVSTGRPRRKGRFAAPARPGFFIVNRGDMHGALALSLTPRSEAPRTRRPGRRALVKEPFLRVRDRALRVSRAAVRDRSVDIEMVGAAGTELLRTSVQRSSAGSYDVVVPDGDGAVFVRARATGARGGRPTDVDWLVDVTAGPTT